MNRHEKGASASVLPTALGGGGDPPSRGIQPARRTPCMRALICCSAAAPPPCKGPAVPAAPRNAKEPPPPPPWCDVRLRVLRTQDHTWGPGVLSDHLAAGGDPSRRGSRAVRARICESPCAEGGRRAGHFLFWQWGCQALEGPCRLPLGPWRELVKTEARRGAFGTAHCAGARQCSNAAQLLGPHTTMHCFTARPYLTSHSAPPARQADGRRVQSSPRTRQAR